MAASSSFQCAARGWRSTRRRAAGRRANSSGSACGRSASSSAPGDVELRRDRSAPRRGRARRPACAARRASRGDEDDRQRAARGHAAAHEPSSRAAAGGSGQPAMKPATQASECSASTVKLRPGRSRSRAASPGASCPGSCECGRVGHGVVAATSQVAASSGSGDQRASRAPTRPSTATGFAFQRRSVARYAASPGRGRVDQPSCTNGSADARPAPADATAAARSAGPEPATPPRARSARTSSIRRAGARGSGSAPRRPRGRAAARARSARPGRRSPARRRVLGVDRAAARSARKHLKPPVRSRTPTPSTRRAYPQPAQRDDPPLQAPVLDPAAVHVARAEHEVGAVERGRDQAREVGRVVREVGVHLDHVARAARRARARSRPCRRARGPALPGRCRTSSRRPRASGRRARRCRRASCRRRRGSCASGSGRADATHDGLDVLGLVVGRQDHPDGAVHDGRVG